MKRFNALCAELAHTMQIIHFLKYNMELSLSAKASFLVQLQEVCQRILDTMKDDPELYQLLKRDFNKLYNLSLKFNNQYRKIVKMETDCEDPEETFDVDVDRLYNLILSTYHLKKEDQWIKAISSIKAIK